MPATAAIYHHPDAIEQAKTPLAGRRVAGQSFLAGYARHVQAQRLHCLADTPQVIEEFRTLMRGYGWSGPIDGVQTGQTVRLADPGTVMLPGPGLSKMAWVRRRAGQQLYSLCGITHTVSTRRIMDGLFEGLSAPVEEWDAIICTSRAVHDVVAHQVEEGARYLSRRFGARRVPRPMLPTIPLGIDTARFARDAQARASVRDLLGVGDDQILILSMGRLSMFEKMHPAPLLIAAQRAARSSGKRLAIAMAGWFSDERQETLYRAAAAEFAPDVPVLFPDGKDPDLRSGVWSAADIFALPVDNIQETFGLAPVEAMAAGLPVVCSDWNGFRDTVEHGVTGLRVRTLASPPGTGEEIARRFEDDKDKYLQYLGLVLQRTAVDVRELAEGLAALADSPERRAEMGAAGIDRARRLYDWAAIIPQYQALWAELNARRAHGPATSAREPDEPANPAAIDPFVLYRGYPTDRLTRWAVISAETPMDKDAIERIMKLTGAHYLRRFVTSAENAAAVQSAIADRGPLRLDDLIAATGLNAGLVTSAVLWLAKFDCVQIYS